MLRLASRLRVHAWVLAPLAFSAGCAAGGRTDDPGAPSDGSAADARSDAEDTSIGVDTGTLGNDASGEVGGCVRPTCAELGADCGAVTDTKCGGVIQCGDCPSGKACGAGGKANVCGTGSPDGGTCAPKSCTDLGAECGSAADGCGDLIDCGTCEAGTCGGGGVPYKCGGAPDAACTKLTCAGQGIECGPAGDGCGGALSCGACSGGDTCGGGGVPGKCGHATCTKLTCAGQGVTCGAAGDGCGGVLSCGVCSAPQSCGGDPAKAGQCGCTGPCALLPTCTAGTTTTLTGVVKDPAGLTPLDNVLVYIANDPSDPALAAFPSTVKCEQCGAAAAGSPLVSTLTGTDGAFTLEGVPVGTGFTLVIQLGRWRRLFKVDVANKCAANVVSGTGTGGTTISGGVLTMPKNKAQGNIPKIGMVTGLGDPIECVLLKMGIDQAEFTNPGKGGRVEVYQSAAHAKDIALGGAYIDLFTTPYADAMIPKLSTYDMVVFGCPGAESTSSSSTSGDGDPLLSAANLAALATYANSGGRVFASHFAFTYLKFGGTANPFNGTATWMAKADTSTSTTSWTATVDVDPAHNPKGARFAQWLGNVGALASTSPPTLSVAEARHDLVSTIAPTQQWLTFTPVAGTTAPLHFTFNTPIGAASSAQCGRVLFSDFHVVSAKAGGQFPTECSAGALTPREKVLEYMLFDLGSCVQPYTPACEPKSCGALGVVCGYASDGCGEAIDCGTCPSGQACGVGGPGKCGTPTCTPTTCAAQHVECGYAGDGCGKLLICGACPSGQACGLGGPGKCGSAGDGGTCSPLSCAAQGIDCGQAGDGCGNVITCPGCPSGQVCGANAPGKCGVPACTPLSCAAQGIECGTAGDGCGAKLECGSCPAGGICGLNAPGKCGTIG
jgi:hypothetical protein